MKHIATLLSVLLIAASASTFAQNTQNAPSPATQGGAATSKAAGGGSMSSEASSPGGQTLMQQREKGMSPDATSGADANAKATGKIKQ